MSSQQQPPGPGDGDELVVRLRRAADGYEPDRDAIWRSVSAGLDAAPPRRRSALVWPLAVAASAALVILGINLVGGGGGDVSGGRGQASVGGPGQSAAEPTGPVPATAGHAPPTASPAGSAGSPGASAAARTAGGAGSAVAPTPGRRPTGPDPSGPSAASPGSVVFSVVAVSPGAQVALPAAAGRPWLAPAAGSSGQGLSGGFGVGPAQVNGSAKALQDSPFELVWPTGTPAWRATGWLVLARGTGGNPSLRIPLRPYGASGSFTVYLATLGGGARLSLTGPSATGSVDVAACGRPNCPVQVTIRVVGTQRLDGSLDLVPTGGGTIGLAAVVQS